MRLKELFLGSFLLAGSLFGCGSENTSKEVIKGLNKDGSNYCEMIHRMDKKSLEEKTFPLDNEVQPGFSDVTIEVGLPETLSVTAAVGYVNGDDWADVLIDGNIYFNCGGKFYSSLPLEDLIINKIPIIKNITAQSIIDLTDDGKSEIVLAGGGTFEEGGARLQVLKNLGDLKFELIDYNFNRPFKEIIFALNFADIDKNKKIDIDASVTLTGEPIPYESAAPDIMLLQKVNGSFERKDYAELRNCSNARNYGSALVSRRKFGLNDLYAKVADIAFFTNEICLWEVEGKEEDLKFIPIQLPLNQIRQARAEKNHGFGIINSMALGIEYVNNTGNVNLSVSDAASHMILLTIDRENNVTDNSDLINYGHVPFQQVSWDHKNRDIDNNGSLDKLITNGVYMSREVVLQSGQAQESASDQYLLLLMNNDGSYTNQGKFAGEIFNKPIDTFGIAAFDYDHKGCTSFLVTPKPIPTERVIGIEETYEYTTKVKLLKNNCNYPNNRVEFLVHPKIEMITIKDENETIFRAPELSQLTSSSEPIISYGCGSSPIEISVLCRGKNDEKFRDQIMPNTSIDLREFCNE